MPANWGDVKIKTANFNSRALNALLSAVTNEEFKKISLTKTAKEAWTILQTTYEGTKAVKTANFNNRALNALFSAVTNEEFKRISSTETAKEAWTILQTT